MEERLNGDGDDDTQKNITDSELRKLILRTFNFYWNRSYSMGKMFREVGDMGELQTLLHPDNAKGEKLYRRIKYVLSKKTSLKIGKDQLDSIFIKLINQDKPVHKMARANSCKPDQEDLIFKIYNDSEEQWDMYAPPEETFASFDEFRNVVDNIFAPQETQDKQDHQFYAIFRAIQTNIQMKLFPGTEIRCHPFIIGPGSAGKSSFAKFIAQMDFAAPNDRALKLYMSDISKADDALHKKMALYPVIEIAEVDIRSKKTFEIAKDFITKSDDAGRRLYVDDITDFDRNMLFVFTMNEGSLFSERCNLAGRDPMDLLNKFIPVMVQPHHKGMSVARKLYKQIHQYVYFLYREEWKYYEDRIGSEETELFFAKRCQTMPGLEKPENDPGDWLWDRLGIDRTVIARVNDAQKLAMLRVGSDSSEGVIVEAIEDELVHWNTHLPGRGHIATTQKQIEHEVFEDGETLYITQEHLEALVTHHHNQKYPNKSPTRDNTIKRVMKLQYNWEKRQKRLPVWFCKKRGIHPDSSAARPRCWFLPADVCQRYFDLSDHRSDSDNEENNVMPLNSKQGSSI